MNISVFLLSFCLITFSGYIKGYCFFNDSDSVSYSSRTVRASALLSKYLQIPSVSGNEKKAGMFLAGFCEKKGLEVDYFTEEKSRYNFAASLYPLSWGKPNIVFFNHIDVVPATDTAGWKYDAYSGKIVNGYIWGRGAIDAKGLAIMQLMALLEIKKKAEYRELPYNVTLLCVSGEEVGGSTGAKIITDFYMGYLNPVVVFGEGGSGLKGALASNPGQKVFGISFAEKKTLWLKLELTQNSFGHGATPAPVYANKSMISALNQLQTRKIKLRFNRSNRLMFRRLGRAEGGVRGFLIHNISWWLLQPLVKKHLLSDPLYTSMVTNTITVTQIYTPPGPPNKIPDYASAILDCRLLPGTNKKRFIRRLKNILDEPDMQITIINESPDCKPSKLNAFYESMKTAILDYHPNAEVIPILFPASTDNSYFRAKGIPVYGLIPAVLDKEMIGNVHSSNEKISLEALESGINVYASFLNHAMEIPIEEDYFVNLRFRGEL